VDESANARAEALRFPRRISLNSPRPRRQELHGTNALTSNTIMATVALKDTEPSLGPAIGIKECKFVASYNWVRSKEPMIYVPGKSDLL
jgi:hypothetical protein